MPDVSTPVPASRGLRKRGGRGGVLNTWLSLPHKNAPLVNASKLLPPLLRKMYSTLEIHTYSMQNLAYTETEKYCTVWANMSAPISQLTTSDEILPSLEVRVNSGEIRFEDARHWVAPAAADKAHNTPSRGRRQRDKQPPGTRHKLPRAAPPASLRSPSPLFPVPKPPPSP